MPDVGALTTFGEWRILALGFSCNQQLLIECWVEGIVVFQVDG